MNDKIMRGRSLSALIILTAIFCLLSLASPALALQQKAVQKRTSPRGVVQYVCPMHPEVTSRRRGRCPKCGMNLVVKKDAPKASASEVNDAASTVKTTTDVSTQLRIPDITVYDQNNRRLNFYTDLVKGKTVAINFIFTALVQIA